MKRCRRDARRELPALRQEKEARTPTFRLRTHANLDSRLRRLHRIRTTNQPGKVREENVDVTIGSPRNRRGHLRPSLDLRSLATAQAREECLLRIRRRMFEILFQLRVVSPPWARGKPHHILRTAHARSVRPRDHKTIPLTSKTLQPTLLALSEHRTSGSTSVFPRKSASVRGVTI